MTSRVSNTVRLTLREHAKFGSEVALTQVQARTLSELSLQVGQQTSKKVLRVGLGRTTGMYTLEGKDVVGVISVAGISVIIEPKAGVQDLASMLSPDQIVVRNDSVPGVGSGDFVRHLVRLFLDALEEATSEGFPMGYSQTFEIGVSPRGNIDFNWGGSTLAFPARYSYSQFTNDTPHNRFLRHVLTYIVQALGYYEPLGSRAYHIRESLDITDSDIFPDVNLIDGAGADYFRALRLGEMIVRASGASLAHGNFLSSGMLFYMPKVYEDFVVTCVEAFCAREGFLFDTQGSLRRRYIDKSNKLLLKPDFSIWSPSGDTCLLVGDVKYKTGRTRIPRADVYQMFSYSQILGAPRSLLVYAGPDTKSTRVKFSTHGHPELHAISLGVASLSVSDLRDSLNAYLADLLLPG